MLLSCLKSWRRKHGGSVGNTPTSSPENSVDIDPEYSTTSTSGAISSDTSTGSAMLHENSTDPLNTALLMADRKRSKAIGRQLKKDGKLEQKYIKLLLLGPGEAGKSTLIRQMQLIHGEPLDLEEKMDKIQYIRQNIFDCMVAILVAMREFHIPYQHKDNQELAELVLNHSQVYHRDLTSKDILNSPFLASPEFFEAIDHLWQDEGVKRAYGRSSEYQLLDCAAYFFERISTIRQPDYIPTEQDVLRCRVMTTSITETKFEAPYRARGRNVHFKVLDVGGQRGERRKWITLFDKVTAVLFVQDISSFDQTLREDSQTNRLLESLKVFYQVITTKYLQSVSVLTFMNKIDRLKEKIESGADFGEAMERMKIEAQVNSCNPLHGDKDRLIYRKLYEILAQTPYKSFRVTDMDRKVFCEAFPEPETDHNHNMTFRRRLAGMLTQRNSNSSLYADMNEEVVKAATYMKFLLKQIIDKVEEKHHAMVHFAECDFRAYEFHYTCAVDKSNITKVIDGCKNIIVKDYLNRIGLQIQ